MPEQKSKRALSEETMHQVYIFLGGVEYPTYLNKEKLDHASISEEQFKSLAFSDTVAEYVEAYSASASRSNDAMAKSIIVVRAILLDNRSKIRLNIDLAGEYDEVRQVIYMGMMPWFASDLNRLWNIDAEYSHGIKNTERLDKLKGTLKKILYNVAVVNEAILLQNSAELKDYLRLIAEENSGMEKRVSAIIEVIAEAEGKKVSPLAELFRKPKQDQQSYFG